MPKLGNTQVAEASSIVEAEVSDIVLSRLLRAQNFSIDDRYGRGSFVDSLIQKTAWSNSFALGAINEYKRFMVLQSLDLSRQLRPSVILDSVWHLHLLYTANYQHFCRLVLHTDFMHHDPSKGGALEEQVEQLLYYHTLIAYEQTFCAVPPEEYWGP